MKNKQFAVLYIVFLCFATIVSFYIPKSESAQASEETIVIPKEAIRLRILANSDQEKDQIIKRAVRDEVNANITQWVEDLTSLEDAREVIKSHIPDIQKIAESYVKEHGLNQEVNVEFGPANFPTKLYGQYLYPAGEYEAIVITIGEGKGANWWCVLFPPLCFLDFSNGTAVSHSPMDDEEEKQVEDNKSVAVETNPSTTVEDISNSDNIEETDKENQAAKQSIYVEQDEKQEVLEKKVFVVELFKDIFAE